MERSSVIVLVIALLVMAAWAGYKYSKKRSDALQEFAVRRGLSFMGRTDLDIYEKFPDFWLFSEGMEQSVQNLISGVIDHVQVSLFDYQYKTGAGPGQMSMERDRTVIVLGSDKLSLPSFQLYPRNSLYVISSFLGKQDITVPSQPVFSKAYVLRGDDEGAVRNVFSDTICSFFSNRTGWNAEGKGKRLLVYRDNMRTSPEEMQNFLSEGLEILKLFEQGV